jgi:hypothetical protein
MMNLNKKSQLIVNRTNKIKWNNQEIFKCLIDKIASGDKKISFDGVLNGSI